LRSGDPEDHKPACGDPLDHANVNSGLAGTVAALDVRALRLRMNMTQHDFAGLFGFPVATLRHWERGNRSPSGTALVLLSVIRENPRFVMQAVRKARLRNPAFERMRRAKSSRAPPGYSERRSVRQG
jgi:putative transcriptional regulator